MANHSTLYADTSDKQISLGVELEFLVPDAHPEDSESPWTDPDPSDHRWYLTDTRMDHMDEAYPSLSRNTAPLDYIHFQLAKILLHDAHLPALTNCIAEDPDRLASFIDQYHRDHPHRARLPRGVIKDARYQIWQLMSEPTVYMDCEDFLYQLYGWHPVELISPVFTSLPALRADLDAVCTELRRQVRTTVNKTTGVHVHAAVVNMENGEATRMTRVQIKRAISLYCLFEADMYQLVAPWRRFEDWMGGSGSMWCRRIMAHSKFCVDARERESAVAMPDTDGNGSETSAESDTESSDILLNGDDTASESSEARVEPTANFDSPFEERFAEDETYEDNVPNWVSGDLKRVLEQVWAAPSRRVIHQGLLEKNPDAAEESLRLALNLSRHGDVSGGVEPGWTLEFRILQGTLDPVLLGRWAEVVQGIMRIATLDAGDFKEFLERQDVDWYTNLFPQKRVMWFLNALDLDRDTLVFWRAQMIRYERPGEEEVMVFLPPLKPHSAV